MFHQHQDLAARHEYQALLYSIVKGITGGVGTERPTKAIWLTALRCRDTDGRYSVLTFAIGRYYTKHVLPSLDI
jgi:hypothetical protein